jgi:hypothetical protein
MRNFKRLAWTIVAVVVLAVVVHGGLQAWSMSTLAGASWAQGACPTCHKPSSPQPAQ